MTEKCHLKTHLLSDKQRFWVLELWKECFDDSVDFINFMLDGALYDAEIFMLFDGQKLCSMFFLMSIELKCADEKKIPAYYLYAAATRNDMRGKGFFSNLLDYSYSFMKENGSNFLLCRPGNENLFRFYEKLGFYTCAFYGKKQIIPEYKGYDFKKISDFGKLYEYYLTDCEQYKSTVLKNEDTFLYSVKCALFENDAELYEFEKGFLIIKDKKDIIFICSPESKTDIAESLFYSIGHDGILTEYSHKKGLPYAMIKKLDGTNDIFCTCSLLFE